MNTPVNPVEESRARALAPDALFTEVRTEGTIQAVGWLFARLHDDSFPRVASPI